MRLHQLVRSPLLLLFVLTVAACREPSAPVPTTIAEGRYAVVSVNGVAPPTLIIDSPTLYITLIADTLVVSADGDGTWRSTYRWSSEVEPPALVSISVPITVRKESGVFLLRQLPCPADVTCEVPDPSTIRVVDDTLETTARFGTFRWRRVTAGN